MPRRSDGPGLTVHLCTPTPDQERFVQPLRAWLAAQDHHCDDLTAAPLAMRLTAARDCDLCLVLLGPTFGVRDPLSSFSHAELEAAAAADAQPGKVLVFAEEGVESPTSPEQREFIERLRNFTGGTFQTICRTPNELIAQLRAALAVWRPPAPRAPSAPAAVPAGAVMISSTGDLIPERDAAHALLVELGLPVIDYLRAASEAVAPLERVVSWAGGCRALLLILGPRYGYISPADGLGVTELEFVTALGADRPILAFIRSDAITSGDADQPQFLERVRAFVPPKRIFTYTDLASFRVQARAALDALPALDAPPPTEPPSVPAAEAQRWYRRQVRRWLGRLPHLLRPDGMPLEEVFVSLREAKGAKDGALAEREAPANDDHVIYTQSNQTSRLYFDALDVDEALRRYPRMVLRGDPGAGKSVALRWYAVTAPDDMIPVLLRLAAYARERASGQVTGLLDATAREERRLALAPAPGVSAWRAALESGRGLLLLDGLDEVPSAQQPAIIADIQALAAALPPESRIVVATRIAGYTAQLGADFTICDVLPLNPDQQRRLVLQWYRAAPGASGQGTLTWEEAQARTEQLIGLLSAQPKLSVWARTPLLLTFLALLLARSGGDDAPLAATRAIIYRRVLRLILGRWRTLNQQQGGAWHLWEKEQLLLGLARRGALEGGGELTTTTEAEAAWGEAQTQQGAALAPDLAAADLLRELSDEDGALIRLGAGQYTFLHPTFQEYLGASLLAAADAPHRLDLVTRHRIHARWDEMTLALVSELDRLGRHDDASAVVETLRRGNLQPIAPGGPLDPMRLALVRAIKAQGDREPHLALAGSGPRLARDWRRWRDATAEHVRTTTIEGKPLEPGLSLPDVTRRYLISTLNYFGAAGYPLLDDLRQQARDPDISMRSNSLGALRALALFDLPGARAAFETALAESGQKIAIAASVDELRAMLRDPNPLNRRAGIALLGRLGTAAAPAVDDLRSLMDDPDPNNRPTTIMTLGRIGPAAASAVPAIVASVDWANPTGTLGFALQALENIGPAAVGASDDLVNAVLHPEQSDRSAYAAMIGNTLAHTGLTPTARQELLAALAPAAGDALRLCALGLLPSLAAMLGIRRQALLDLATGDQSSEMAGVRSHLVGQALAHQTPDDMVWTVAELRRLLRQAIAASDAKRIGSVVGLLTALGPAAAPALDDLRAVLTDERIGYWYRPMSPFAAMGPAAAPAIPDMLRVVEPLAARVAMLDPNTTDPRQRYERSSSLTEVKDTLRALGQIGVGAPDLLAFLHRLAHGPDAALRDAAINTIEILGPAAAPLVDDLIQALGDTRPDAVWQAINALGKLGAAAFPALGELCRRLDAPAAPTVLNALDLTLAALLPQITDAAYDPAFHEDDADIPVVPAAVLAAVTTVSALPAVQLPSTAPLVKRAPRRPWWRRAWSRAR